MLRIRNLRSFEMIQTLIFALFSFASTVAVADIPKLDIAKIDQITGMKGKYSEQESVYELSYPRKDLKVTAAGVKLNPAMGLTAWTAFTKSGGHAMVMGDIVLTEDQVNPVMSGSRASSRMASIRSPLVGRLR